MTVRVSINGFGRIGRHVLRAIAESGRTDLKVVAVNDTAPLEQQAHYFKYDSVHGPFKGDVKTTDKGIDFGMGEIPFYSDRNPENLPWGALDVDIVLECTGAFNSKEKATAHITAGAKKVLVSAPATNADATVVYGVNHDTLKADDIIVSNASCTTNCLAPFAKVLDELCGIEQGFMTTIHAYTGDQRLVDAKHKDLRRARAAAMSIVPTSTGAARAVGLVLPQLAGKLDGTSVRIPTPNVSMVELVFIPGKTVSVEDINSAMQNAADGPMKGVLAINDEPLVSIDFTHHPASSVFDVTQTQIVEEKLVRVVSWYDNEWGFSQRMGDMAVYMGSL